MYQLPDVNFFINHVNNFYKNHGRIFPWRHVTDPYLVLVSEVMLQQTQTGRVVDKYNQFISEIPGFPQLATCPEQKLFMLWQGLGYNRRALYLKYIAQWVVEKHGGQLPNDPDVLRSQKGLGHATANSICTFAFNRSAVFIETNIRAVFLHHFFAYEVDVPDNQLMPLIKMSVEYTDNPRDWYYALMDYGVFLKKEHVNPSRASKHYQKQSTFKGSTRQVRGEIVRILITLHHVYKNELVTMVEQKFLDKNKDMITDIIETMYKEKLIKISLSNVVSF